MTYLSPSHAWAAWLERPGDLALAAENAATVRAALEALTAGNLAVARRLWSSVDGDLMLGAWNAQIRAMRDKSRWPDALREPPAKTAKATKKLSQTISTSVFERDRYRCSYCGIPVVTQRKDGDIPRLVAAFPEVTPWLASRDGSISGSGKSGALRNADVGKWLWITAVADHVVPASQGGPTELHNLITSCSNCNYSKADWTLQQLDVLIPYVPVITTK